MSLLRELHRILKCPDDGAELRLFDGCLECAQCNRQYPILASNLVELLPLEAALPDDGSVYGRGYTAERQQPFSFRPDILAWGSPETTAPNAIKRKHRQVAAIQRLLEENTKEPKSLLCDFSAGAGMYTLAYAKAWRFVLHCDLSVDSLNYAHHKAARMAIDNVLFVRMDYLSPPFRSGLQRIVCLDTLIRGELHEKLLLHAIQGALSDGGVAFVDFHNWWHNPLRRLGLLRNNFGANRSYGKGELNHLFAAAGIVGQTCFPFHQESFPNAAAQKALSHLLPPTRWIYQFSGAPAASY